jgi:hypothetical protein
MLLLLSVANGHVAFWSVLVSFGSVPRHKRKTKRQANAVAGQILADDLRLTEIEITW